MRFLVVSDLHNEFIRPAILAGKDLFAPRAPDGSYDAVILAGDIDLGTNGLTWAAGYFHPLPIIMIAGNHEFYGGRTLLPTYSELRAVAKGLGIHFLEMDEVTINGVRIAGATLWTNAHGLKDGAENQLNDFRQINWTQGEPLRIRHWREYHQSAMEWLTLLQDIDIMITHHAPSYQSTDWRSCNNPDLNPLYASDLDEYVDDLGAKYWIHGHMHTTNRYTIGKTQVVSNPRGYVPDYINPLWDPSFIIEIASEAQLDEQGSSKPTAVGSSPTGSAKHEHRMGGIPAGIYSEPHQVGPRKGWWNHRQGGTPQE